MAKLDLGLLGPYWIHVQFFFGSHRGLCWWDVSGIRKVVLLSTLGAGGFLLMFLHRPRRGDPSAGSRQGKVLQVPKKVSMNYSTDGKVSLQRVKEGQGWSRALETSVWHILAQHDKGIIKR